MELIIVNPDTHPPAPDFQKIMAICIRKPTGVQVEAVATPESEPFRGGFCLSLSRLFKPLGSEIRDLLSPIDSESPKAGLSSLTSDLT